MNTAFILILSIPIIEIYLFIKVGSKFGAFSTISLTFLTAVFGLTYAKYQGFNTLRSALSQLVKNEVPIFEIISGAALAFAALLLIIPGFATDFIGVLFLLPFTRKLIIQSISKKYKTKTYKNEKDFIEGEFKDMDEK